MPILLEVPVVSLLVTFTVTYCVACGLGHVPWAFPYISETGTYDPESCIFGLGVNIASFTMLVDVYLRYLQLKEYLASCPEPKITRRHNIATLVLGLLASGGLVLVANFQVKRVPVFHYTGAFFCFVFGIIYWGWQSVFSKRMCPHVSNPSMVRLRYGLTALSVVSFLVCLGAGLIASAEFDGGSQTDWTPENKGYALHCVSAAGEWLTSLIFIVIIATYIPEMKQVTISPPKFRILLLESVSATEEFDKN